MAENTVKKIFEESITRHLATYGSHLRSEFSTSMSRLDPRNCWRQLSYAIKNQLAVGSLRSKAPSMGFWMPELVLYGIIELAEQHYETLDQ